MFDHGGEEIRNVLTYFLGSELRLGPRHLLGLPQRVLDVTTSCVLETVAHYQKSTSESFIVVHDEASYMSHDRQIWDALTKPEDNPQLTRIQYPLGVEETSSVGSAESVQVQMADIIAGATGAFARSRLGDQSNMLTTHR